MMIKSIRKLLALAIVTTTILGTSAIGVNAEWKNNSDSTWSNTEVTNDYVGWKQVDSQWYYFKSGIMQTGWVQDGSNWYYLSSKGNMLSNTTTPDGFNVGNNGAWIQNITTNNTSNTSTSLENTTTSNSNNLTTLNNNTDNSTKNTATNTGTINNGVVNNGTMTNNINVNVEQNDNSYEKQLKKIQEDNKKSENSYYQYLLDGAKSDLQEAQAQLERIKNQKSVQSYKKQADGSWGYEYSVDQQQLQRAEKNVSDAQRRVSYYQSLIK